MTICARGFAVVLCSALGALPSCSLLDPDPAGGDVRITAGSLTAIVKLPQGYDSTRAYPLLVALHGNGGSADSFAPTFSSFQRDSLLVAVPQGAYPRSSGGYSWFYLTNDRSLWEEYDTQSVADIVGLVDAIGARYAVGKVFVLGFSQGASLAYMTGLLHPSRVTGVLAVGGLMPEIDQEGSIVHARQVEEARGVLIFVARGTSDALVGPEAYTAQREFFLANGYSVTAYEYEGGHYLTDELLGRMRQWLRENSRE